MSKNKNNKKLKNQKNKEKIKVLTVKL